MPALIPRRCGVIYLGCQSAGLDLIRGCAPRKNAFRSSSSLHANRCAEKWNVSMRAEITLPSVSFRGVLARLQRCCGERRLGLFESRLLPVVLDTRTQTVTLTASVRTHDLRLRILEL